jgi:hypothetical protein
MSSLPPRWAFTWATWAGPNCSTAGALAFVLGGILSVVLIRLKRANFGSEIAFGPSMLAAALGTVLLAS